MAPVHFERKTSKVATLVEEGDEGTTVALHYLNQEVTSFTCVQNPSPKTSCKLPTYLKEKVEHAREPMEYWDSLSLLDESAMSQ